MAEFTNDKLEGFRERLLDAKAAAEAVLGNRAGEERVEASGTTIGRLTRIDAIQMQAMADMSRRQVDIRLQQINAALASIDKGTFGICRLCKEDVALSRLEAIPEAPFCMSCQEGLE
jgi:DnaK suppressor protein